MGPWMSMGAPWRHWGKDPCSCVFRPGAQKKLIPLVPSGWLNALTPIFLETGSSASTRSSLFRHAQGGFQKVIGHGLRDRVCNPHAKFQRFGVAAGEADRFFQLVPQRKNLLRVTQGDTTLAGELQPTPPLAKEVVA